MAALQHRARTGEGQHCDVSLLDAAIFQSNGYPMLAALGVPMPRMGNEFTFSIPCNTYHCRDGIVMMGTLLDTHWKVFARIAGRYDLAENPDYATIPGRMKHRGECNALAAKWCADHTVTHVLEICGREGIACAPVNTYEQAAHDPHVLARDMLQDTVQEDGSTAPIVGPAIKFSRTPTKVRSGARALGADTDQILGELGIDSTERDRLRGAKIV